MKDHKSWCEAYNPHAPFKCTCDPAPLSQTERCCDGSCCDICFAFKCDEAYCPCHTQRSDWRERFAWSFGFDAEYMKTLPATLAKEDVGLLIQDIEKWVAVERENMRREVLAILVDEIATAHKEGTPTARLTSAYNRLKNE